MGELDMSQSLTIELPEEFLELCKRDHTTPETVLRGFIGDLCATTSMNFDRPRDDGYGSNGSDERECAWRYYDRAGYNRAQFGE